MNKRTLKVLEYEKILETLSGFAASQGAKRRCLRLKPYKDIVEIEKLQSETRDAMLRISKYGNLSFGGVRDIGESLKMLSIGSPLSMKELLDIAALLENADTAQLYGDKIKDSENKSGAAIIQETRNNKFCQQWLIRKNSNGTYSFLSRLNSTLAIAVYQGFCFFRVLPVYIDIHSEGGAQTDDPEISAGILTVSVVGGDAAVNQQTGDQVRLIYLAHRMNCDDIRVLYGAFAKHKNSPLNEKGPAFLPYVKTFCFLQV